MTDIYLRIKQVAVITGLSRATIYSMMASGCFPMKTALGVRAVGWLSSEIEAWMGERKVVVKLGREAKPAHRKMLTKHPGQASAARIEVKLPPKLGVDAGSQGRYSDLPDTDFVQETDRQSSVSDRLRRINAMKRQEGTPIKSKTHSVSVFAYLKRQGVVGGSEGSTKPASAKAPPESKK